MAVATWISAHHAAGTRDPRLRIVSRYVLVGGHRMHYLCAGGGPPLVLLHGVLGTAACWKRCMRRLGRHFTVYAPDALGIGKSERVTGLDPSLEATARRLAVFLDVLGIGRAHLLGTSHGGAVAMMFAAQFPDRVGRLVLHAPANPYSNRTSPLLRFYRSRLGRSMAHFVPALPRQLQQVALRRMYANPRLMRKGVLERYVSSLSVPGTVAHVLGVLRYWFKDMDHLEEVLPRLEAVPARLLWGTDDRAVSLASAAPLAKRMGAPEPVVMAGVGHLPFEEVPGAFSKLVLDSLGVSPDRQGLCQLSPMERSARPCSSPGSRRLTDSTGGG